MTTRRTYPNLLTYFTETGDTQERMARRLDITQSYMSKLTNGLQQPELKLALRIARLARVPLESLITEARQEKNGISCVR